MQSRVAQAVTEEGMDGDADRWAYDNRRKWAAAPGWDEAWEYAKNTHEEPDYDPGTDEAVITDPMILSQIQVMLAGPGRNE
jgi:hypothetical protein